MIGGSSITDAKKPKQYDPEGWEPVFGSPLKNAPKETRVDIARHAVKDLFKKQREAANAVDKGETRKRLAEVGLEGFREEENPYWVIARLERFRRVDRHNNSSPSIRNLDGADAGKILKNVRTDLHRGIISMMNARKLRVGGLFVYQYRGQYINSKEVMVAHKYQTKAKSEWDEFLRAQEKEIKERLCSWCGIPLPENARANQEYCKRECKEAAKQSRDVKR